MLIAKRQEPVKNEASKQVAPDFSKALGSQSETLALLGEQINMILALQKQLADTQQQVVDLSATNAAQTKELIALKTMQRTVTIGARDTNGRIKSLTIK